MNFHIWSRKENAWWKAEAEGYTKKRSEAGVFSVQQVASHRLNKSNSEMPGTADVLILIE